LALERRSTLHAVADRAGVSIASVSRVLNDLPASPETTARVRSAVAELGYAPHAAARALRVGASEQIAIAVADVGNPVYVQMMREVSEVLGDTRFRLMLSSTGNDPAAQIDLLENLNRGYADGLILIPLRVTGELTAAISRSRLPIVVIGSLPDGVDVDNVRADSATGVGLALDHLVETGRTRIAFLNGPRDTVPGAARHSGFVAGMKKRKLLPARIAEAADFTFDAGLPAAAAVLATGERPDAIVCANDLLAIATMKVLGEHGLSIPVDVAVVGMDDSDMAMVANPSLTSVDLGARERSRVAAELLVERLADPSLPARRRVVAPSLFVRESTR
jgi:LacI family transcriptional regulator